MNAKAAARCLEEHLLSHRCQDFAPARRALNRTMFPRGAGCYYQPMFTCKKRRLFATKCLPHPTHPPTLHFRSHSRCRKSALSTSAPPPGLAIQARTNKAGRQPPQSRPTSRNPFTSHPTTRSRILPTGHLYLCLWKSGYELFNLSHYSLLSTTHTQHHGLVIPTNTIPCQPKE